MGGGGRFHKLKVPFLSILYNLVGQGQGTGEAGAGDAEEKRKDREVESGEEKKSKIFRIFFLRFWFFCYEHTLKHIFLSYKFNYLSYKYQAFVKVR